MIDTQDEITFEEFKAWLAGLIRGKQGALPDLEDWKAIKETIDKVVVPEETLLGGGPGWPVIPEQPYFPYTPAVPPAPPVYPYVPQPYWPSDGTGSPWPNPLPVWCEDAAGNDDGWYQHTTGGQVSGNVICKTGAGSEVFGGPVTMPVMGGNAGTGTVTTSTCQPNLNDAYLDLDAAMSTMFTSQETE